MPSVASTRRRSSPGFACCSVGRPRMKGRPSRPKRTGRWTRMDAHDLLEIAGEWAVGDREVEWRAAVSRAYFGAFHVARRLLRRLGFEVPAGDHAYAYLWRRLGNSGHPEVRHAGHTLNALRSDRNWADYDLGRPFAQATATNRVQTALEVVSILDSVPSPPPAVTAITEAIRTYERDVLGEVTWRG